MICLDLFRKKKRNRWGGLSDGVTSNHMILTTSGNATCMGGLAVFRANSLNRQASFFMGKLRIGTPSRNKVWKVAAIVMYSAGPKVWPHRLPNVHMAVEA